MAKYGPSSIVVEYDSSGGALQNITQNVQTINDINVEQLLEEAHTFGDSWEEHLPIGVGKVDAVELGGLFDDGTGATDINTLFAGRIPETPAAAVTRTLKITWGGTKTTSVETHLVSYKRSADRNGMTKFSVKLQPTGQLTEV